MRLVLGLMVAAALGGSAAGDPAEKDKKESKFLTKKGNLTRELVVYETEGAGLASKSRRWTVKPNGQWELAVRDRGIKTTKGKLTKEQLKTLADELEKYGLTTLKRKFDTRIPRGAKSCEMRYGKRQVATNGPLGEPDAKTLKGRYAGIVAIVEKLLKGK